MKKIVFVINTLSIGGAEKALVSLANALVDKGYTVGIVVLFRKSNNLAVNLNNKISVIYLLKNRDTLLNKIKLNVLRKNPNKLFKIFDNYDVIFSFLEENPCYLVSKYKRNRNQKKITIFHTISSLYVDILLKLYGSKEQLEKFIKTYDEILCVSDGVKDDFLSNICNFNNVSTIENVIDIKNIIKLSTEKADLNINNQLPLLCCVGRVEKEKGTLRLIDAFEKFQNVCQLLIVGGGSLLEECINKVKEKNIKNVFFVGYQSNPYKYIVKCDAVISPSFVEGYGIAKVEGLILGKPFISTDVNGVDEFLGKYKCGIKCDNSNEGIINGIERYLSNINKYNKEAMTMSKYLKSKQIIDKYIELIER